MYLSLLQNHVIEFIFTMSSFKGKTCISLCSSGINLSLSLVFISTPKRCINSASLPNNNPKLNSWDTFYSQALFPNRYHLPYLHVLGCWEWQIDWENSHITTQWERECVMCGKQRDATTMALTPSKFLLSTQPHRRDCGDGRHRR